MPLYALSMCNEWMTTVIFQVERRTVQPIQIHLSSSLHDILISIDQVINHMGYFNTTSGTNSLVFCTMQVKSHEMAATLHHSRWPIPIYSCVISEILSKIRSDQCSRALGLAP